MKKRLLFVDDQPNVLDGLRRSLHGLRHTWDMEFVDNGPEALSRLASRPFDVIVTDIRMPGMDGSDLLAVVMQRYPQVIRIALSGSSDQDVILKSVGPTHLFLSKPCDLQQLVSVVTRASTLREHLASESLKRLTSGLKTLPSPPDLYHRLLKALESPDTSIGEVARLISEDVGMAAKILQLVNSSFFGLPRRVSGPTDAVALLGMQTVKSLVLCVGIFSEDTAKFQGGYSIGALRNHSVAVSTYAKQIAAAEASATDLREKAVLAGLLHDVGQLVLIANFPKEYREIRQAAQRRTIPLSRMEKEVLGSTHADVGAYLLGLWGFADVIVEAVAFHHSPADSATQSFSPLTAVHVADALEHQRNPQSPGDAELDQSYLAQIGLADRIDVWRNLIGRSNKKEDVRENCSTLCRR